MHVRGKAVARPAKVQPCMSLFFVWFFVVSALLVVFLQVSVNFVVEMHPQEFANSNSGTWAGALGSLG